MSTLHSKIEDLIRTFAAELQAVWTRAAQQAIGAVSDDDAHDDVPVTLRKRRPEEIETLQRTFVAYIRKNPGLRIEQINKGMGTKTKDLRIPIAHLIAVGSVVADGERRSTTYRVPAAKR